MHVTLHLWRVRRQTVPAALLRMATQRDAVRRLPGCTFVKLLGTGRGRTFTPADADPCTWAILACWNTEEQAREFDDSLVVRRWQGGALAMSRFLLVPLSAHGRWSGQEPFGRPARQPWPGPVAAITRARIRTRHLRAFWAAVPPVTGDLLARPGLIGALGIGEAPVGLQGTFSLWRSAVDLQAFAYRGSAHTRVIARTTEVGWYAEELFAQFAVLDSGGDLLTTPRSDPAGG